MCPVAALDVLLAVANVTWWCRNPIVSPISLVCLPSDLCLGKKLDSAKDKLRKEAREADRLAREALVKAERLRKQLDFLEVREREMVARESASLEEMEAFESQSSLIPALDDPLSLGSEFDLSEWVSGFADDNASVAPNSS